MKKHYLVAICRKYTTEVVDWQEVHVPPYFDQYDAVHVAFDKLRDEGSQLSIPSLFWGEAVEIGEVP